MDIEKLEALAKAAGSYECSAYDAAVFRACVTSPDLILSLLSLARRAKEAEKAICVWEYYDAPADLQISENGGDEDELILIPPGVPCPWKLTELGCCSNDRYRIEPDGSVSRRGDSTNDGWLWTPTGRRIPERYAGYEIIVSAHA